MKQDRPEMFKALAVETRVKILDLIKTRGPLGAKAIAESVGITPAAASQHLKVLRQAGLVKSERKGYWIPYSIDRQALEQCRRAMDDVCNCSCRPNGEEAGLNLENLKERERELSAELAALREEIRRMEGKKGK